MSGNRLITTLFILTENQIKLDTFYIDVSKYKACFN